MTVDDPQPANRDIEALDLVALVPQGLAVREPIRAEQVFKDALLQRAAQRSSDWQTTVTRVTTWEVGGTFHRVQRDRMTELGGLMCSVGEQIALARSALIECEYWRAKRAEGSVAGDEMCHRALAELLTSFCVSAGHGLANLTGRGPRRLAVLEQRHRPFSAANRPQVTVGSGEIGCRSDNGSRQ